MAVTIKPGYALTSTEFKKWYDFPRVAGEDEMGWYGVRNSEFYPPPSYSPPPNQNVMNMVESLLSLNKNKWTLDKAPLWSWDSYSILCDWVTSTTFPQPYANFKLDVQLIKAKPMTSRDANILCHLVCWVFHLCKPVFELNQKIKGNKRFQAFPLNWGLPLPARDGHYMEIQALSLQMPPLNSFPCPPNDIGNICIKFYKSSFTQAQLSSGHLSVAQKDDPLKIGVVLNDVDKTKIANYFFTNFPELSTQASLIITGETLPYYQWQGIFICQLLNLVRESPVVNMLDYGDWKKRWPLVDPRLKKGPIKFKGFPVSTMSPTFYWPIPSPDQEALLLQIAATPGCTLANGGTITMNGDLAAQIRTFFAPQGWLLVTKNIGVYPAASTSLITSLQGSNTPAPTSSINTSTAGSFSEAAVSGRGNGILFGSLDSTTPASAKRLRDGTFKDETNDTVSNVDAMDVSSEKTMKALQQMMPFVYGYAVSFRSFISGRSREQWEWDKSGNLLNATPQDRFRTCQLRASMGFSSNLLSDEPESCIPSQIVGWEHPESLPEEELRIYLKSGYPMPPLRQQNSGESTDDYLRKRLASEGGYVQWINLVIAHPEKLVEFPVGAIIGKDVRTGETLYNLYPSYGMWDTRVGSSTLHWFLNPYHDTYGKFYLDEILGMGDRAFQFLKNIFEQTVDVTLDAVDKTGKQVKNTAWDLAAPAAIFGAIGIAMMVAYSETIGKK